MLAFLLVIGTVLWIDQSTKGIFDCTGLRDVAMATKFWLKSKLAQNGRNFSCKLMQHIHAEFGFEIGFVLSRNSSVTLPYTRDKGALPWQAIFGTELAIDAYKCISTRDNKNAITYNMVFHGQPIQRRHF